MGLQSTAKPWNVEHKLRQNWINSVEFSFEFVLKKRDKMTEPEKMKVAESRAALQERGLDTKGTKPVLVARLTEAIEAEKKEPTPESEPEKVEEAEAMDETP